MMMCLTFVFFSRNGVFGIVEALVLLIVNFFGEYRKRRQKKEILYCTDIFR